MGPVYQDRSSVRNDESPRARRAGFARLDAALLAARMDLGRVSPVSLVMRAMRRFPALWLGGQIDRLLVSSSYRAHLASVDQEDPLFFLSHRHYLARDLTLSQRAAAAACHYLTDEITMRADALKEIYQGEGLVVWQRKFKHHHYEIRLTGGLDVAHEGAQSMSFHADNTRVCVLSFSVVPRSFVVDAPDDGHKAVLITRKQLSRDRSYQKPFFEAFDRSAPAHLVLAALEGLVQARGGAQLFGLRAPSHPIYNAELAPHLAAAYCDFWDSLEGQISSRRAYALEIPMRLRPVEDMKSDRRERALARRGHAEEIRATVRVTVAENMLADAPPL